MNYSVVSFYAFTSIADPVAEIKAHKVFTCDRDMTGRIYIASDGINAQFSGVHADAKAYMDWCRERFGDLHFKIQPHHENAFPRMTIKVRPELVALGQPVDTKRGGEYVSPAQWREMLESQEYLVLDVRNDYEWELGRFKGSQKPQCNSFRDFPAQARRLKEEYDPKKTKVMMCCTGGIRCEIYSVLLKDEGFEEVFQLDGGILNYAEKEEGKHWDGKLFVFDDRLAVDINPEAEVIGRCHLCQAPADEIYNCADMDCNRLYICCSSCLTENKGCCSTGCQSSPRLRPLEEQKASKPFRRWHQYFGSKPAAGGGCALESPVAQPSAPA